MTWTVQRNAVRDTAAERLAKVIHEMPRDEFIACLEELRGGSPEDNVDVQERARHERARRLAARHAAS